MKNTAQQIRFYLQDRELPILGDFLVNKKDRQYQIWQRNPLAIELYNKKILEQKLDYIHNNTVQRKWNLVDDKLDYALSSIRFYELGEENLLLTHYFDYIS